jgi:uncharacterized protein (DUF433 family)
MPLLQTLDLLAVARETAERANRLVERQESDIGRVATNRYVASNRPVIAGTRIPTEAIWDFHEDGYGIKEIIAEYPRLTSKDIKAAIEFELDRRATKRAS